MDTFHVRLYRQTANGVLQFWQISYEDDTIYIEYGLENGSVQTQVETIEEGKAGRSIEEQVLSRIDSRVNGKLSAGYVYDRDHAIANKPVNELGLKRPMLAASLKSVRNVDFSTLLYQYKYDGHRCLIHNDGGHFIPYSRNGKKINSIREILDVVRHSSLPDGYTLDGELYCHGVPLQRISSWVKRRQEGTRKLVYVVYDVIAPLEFQHRLGVLFELNLPMPIIIAPTWELVNQANIVPALEDSLKLGYEGLILRDPRGLYQDSKRSKYLIKVKQWEDDEFLVKDIVNSREGYGILVCVAKNGQLFRVTAPGDRQAKEDALVYKTQLIGKRVNVKYANLTQDGKPFHPVATAWRDGE